MSMHDTAYELGRLFFQTYAGAGKSILEVGSMNINGSLRDFKPEGSSYVGIDLAAGNGVDIVVRTVAELPFAGEAFDVIVSTSCFEHDMMFWLTFLEMCRVLTVGGYIYLNAPSKGDYHQYPIDAWRFFPDAGIALCAWAKLNECDIQLLESFITENNTDIWNDCVMIFGKSAARPVSSVSERYPLAISIRRWPDLSEVQGRRDRW
jgi:SAM-dependent methyltransferase